MGATQRVRHCEVKVEFLTYYHNYFRLLKKEKFGNKGYALIIMYLLSLEKPVLTQFAKELAPETSLDSCLAAAWILSHKLYFTSNEYDKIVDFFYNNCERNKWNMTEWVKLQRKVCNLVYNG